MKTLYILLEDALSDKINKVYNDKLKGKLHQKPDDFDVDALQLGVVHELNNYNTFKKALAVAMIKLSKDSTAYDNVDAYGRDMADLPTFNGNSGLPNLGMYGQQ